LQLVPRAAAVEWLLSVRSRDVRQHPQERARRAASDLPSAPPERGGSTQMCGPAAVRKWGRAVGSRWYVSGLLIGTWAVALMGIRTHLW